MMKVRPLLLVLALSSLPGCGEKPFSATWESRQSNLDASLRGLSAPDPLTAWVSGSGGSYAFTRDGGETWEASKVTDAESLDFRDVEAFGDGTAYLMSAGSGALSRIYKTTDWGETWTLQHTNGFENGFFNGMAFWDEGSGMVVGDPVDGKLFLLETSDGGGTWRRLENPRLPPTEEEEYGFAASGTNIAVFGENGLAVVSGGSVARVFLTSDRGGTWSVVPTPLRAGTNSTGVFSIAFKDPRTAVAVGGDYLAPDLTIRTVALSGDGGSSWTLAPEPHGVGFRSGVAWRDDSSHPMWVAVGTSGSSYSTDGGVTWITFHDSPFNAVAFAGSVGWAAGPDGSVAKLVVR